jgi:hypothetical protein
MSTPPPNHQTIRLTRGKHTSPGQGACVMELASMLAGEPFTEHPATVCPVIGAYLRSLNDLLGDRARQDLRRYAAAAVGTSGPQALRSRRIELLGDEARRLDARRSRLLRHLLAPPLEPSAAWSPRSRSSGSPPSSCDRCSAPARVGSSARSQSPTT